MSPMDREIIDMRHVDELSMQEAANALDISLEAAKKRYQRALARFRELTAGLHANHLIDLASTADVLFVLPVLAC